MWLIDLGYCILYLLGKHCTQFLSCYVFLTDALQRALEVCWSHGLFASMNIAKKRELMFSPPCAIGKWWVFMCVKWAAHDGLIQPMKKNNCILAVIVIDTKVRMHVDVFKWAILFIIKKHSQKKTKSKRHFVQQSKDCFSLSRLR